MIKRLLHSNRWQCELLEHGRALQQGCVYSKGKRKRQGKEERRKEGREGGREEVRQGDWGLGKEQRDSVEEAPEGGWEVSILREAEGRLSSAGQDSVRPAGGGVAMHTAQETPHVSLWGLVKV